jgi:hypothetical protein
MAKPKKINYRMINPADSPEPYRIMEEVRSAHHPDTLDANICLAWRIDTKPDVDGHLILGRCVRASDLQRELVNWDFVILLNKEVWDDKEFTAEKKRALIDHELCHAEVACDEETGSPKIDVRGRKVWRIRKHDIEEFQAIVSRHGCYKRDLERFAEVLINRKSNPLFARASDETTFQIGIPDANGKTEYSEPMPLSTLHDAAERIRRRIQ